MNAKRVIGIALTAIALLLLAAGVRLVQMRDVSVADAPRIPPGQRVALPQSADKVRPAALTALTPPEETIADAIVTQVFTLQAGWNAVYLGVEPINPSPLVNEGTTEMPAWVHEKSTIEAVFADLAANGALESVWAYNQPISHKDYIVDPGEGLWDEPGWERYVPAENVGADGVSRGFLTNLHTLHANTGYLVRLKDGASGTVTVSGRPVPGHHRWTRGAYNLAGFPVDPSQPPTVAAFTAGSAITEVRQLSSDGIWSAALAAGATLDNGIAYLVYYDDDPAASANYTAPLDILDAPSNGIAFHSGLFANSAELAIRNLAAEAKDVQVSLPAGAGSPVALHLADGASPPVDLREGTITLSLGAPPANGKVLKFLVPTELQPAAGEAMLQISSADLGTRWLIPVSAEAGSRAGLWAGDIVVNDVSESRLGATDASGGDLTIALTPADAAGLRGAAELHEITEGASTSLKITVTLALPDMTPETMAPPELTAPYITGFVFVDANKNGQCDAAEPGLQGVEVRLDGEATTTQADGRYLFEGLAAGMYGLDITPPEGYTSDFTIELPAAEADQPATPATNALPASVTLDAEGATALEPAEYRAQILPSPHTLPYYDAYEQRVEPSLNFGYVRADRALLRAGLCDQPREQLFDLGFVKNGELTAEIASSLASLVGDSHIYVERNGAAVACGDIVVGAPTSFADGRGSQASFRVLLRVSQSGQTALLPYYVFSDGRRTSSAAFLTLQQPITITGPFGVTGAGLEFDLTLPGDDPLNPFKHKYHPDHDNLDRKFEPYDEDVPPYLYESFGIERRVTLVLTALPHDGDAVAAAGQDWGGSTWGGDYREIVTGLHKNAITARGYFVIRRVLPWEQLEAQSYDQ